MKQIKQISLLLAIGIISNTAFAASMSTTGNFQSSATVSASCDLKVNPLSFGNITPTTSNVDISTTMIVKCSKGVFGAIYMAGGNADNNYDRYMKGSNGNTDQLKYNVFPPSYGYDDNYSWGGEAAGFEELKADGTEQTVTVLGRVYANQYIKPDTYTDSLLVTIEY